MTTNANTGPNVYTGNGSASEFDFTFEIKAASEVLVTEVVIATGVETVLAINTDYTVSIDPDETGSITLVAGALPNTKKIVLEPNIPYTQEVDYNENDPFPAETHESALDKSVRLAKQLKVGLNRAVQQPVTATSPVTLPVPEDGKALIWDSGELVNSEISPDDFATALASAEAAATAAETAETNAETAETNAEAAEAAAVIAQGLAEDARDDAEAAAAAAENVRIPRVVTTTDDATAVINVETTDVYELSAVANDTVFTLTGTPVDGQKIVIRYKDAGVSKGLTFTGFTALGVTIPTATTVSKWTYVGVIYNLAATQYHVVSVVTEA